jgi:hypothetical protein
VSTTHEDILQGLTALLAAHPLFAGLTEIGIDVAEPGQWRDLGNGLQDALAVQDGAAPEITRDGGAADDFELRCEIMVAYAVQGRDRTERRRRRDAAAVAISDVVAANRQLGLADVQVYAEAASAARDDNAPIKAAAPVATLLVSLTVDYTAASAAL